jgi:opine dehydrogenase
MKVAILGGGNVALANAVLLTNRGHRVTVWSAVGAEVQSMLAAGAVTGEGIVAGVAPVDAEPDVGQAVRGADVVVIATPAFAHPSIMTACAPHLRAGQPVVIHPVTGGSSLLLSRSLRDRGVRTMIVDLSTSLMTARRSTAAVVQILSLKDLIDVAALPAEEGPAGLALCQALYGDRFALQDNVLTISMDNHNPVYHVPPFICNLSRVEKAEHWIIWPNITRGVAAFIKALDRERMAVMEAYGLKGRTVEDYFHIAFGVPRRDLVEMFGDVERKLKGPVGPQVFEHRFILEDVPYALVFFLALGRVAGIPMPVTDACVTTASAIFGRDFRTQNEILNALQLESLSVAQIRALAERGYQ